MRHIPDQHILRISAVRSPDAGGARQSVEADIRLAPLAGRTILRAMAGRPEKDPVAGLEIRYALAYLIYCAGVFMTEYDRTIQKRMPARIEFHIRPADTHIVYLYDHLTRPRNGNIPIFYAYILLLK
jgi:hypothetical protein